MRRDTSFLLASLVALCGLGCGDDEARSGGTPPPPLINDEVTVFGIAAGLTADPFYDGRCVWVDDLCFVVTDAGACRNPGVPMDVVIVDGLVEAVLCYPAGDLVYELFPGEGDFLLPPGDVGAFVTFAPDTDGQGVVGDIIIDADDVTIFGRGPERTFIDGNVIVRGARAQLRSVTITGSLIFDGALPSLVFSDVFGDVVSTADGTVMAADLVFGDLLLDGRANVIVESGVQGRVELVGFENACAGNFFFIDDDVDGFVTTGEVTESWSCP